MEKKKQSLAKLLKSGYLRISASLLPENARADGLKFTLMPVPAKKELVLRFSKNGSDDHLAKRQALYSNGSSKSPLISVKMVLKFMGLKVPKKSLDVPVKKKDGALVVQF